MNIIKHRSNFDVEGFEFIYRDIKNPYFEKYDVTCDGNDIALIEMYQDHCVMNHYKQDSVKQYQTEYRCLLKNKSNELFKRAILDIVNILKTNFNN